MLVKKLVGLFFSPTKELNIDIAKSFGGINLDNYIGDPSDNYKSNYSTLDSLRNYYFKRFDGRDIYAYINLIKLYEKSMFEDITANPTVVTEKYALLSAAWFFNKNGLHKLADGGSTDAVVTQITKRVNGGTIGLADRIKHFKEYHALLA